jgi:hypothetical protein
MAIASGLSAQVGIAEESTYGTFVAPTRYHEFVSESVKLEIERLESRGLRAGRRTLHRWAPGVQRVTGDVEMELAAQGFGLWFKHVFGGVATSGVGPYTHTFTPGTLDAKSLSVQIGRPDVGGTVRAFSYLGCKVASAEISAAINEIAMMRVSLYGAHEDTSQTLGTASYPATLSPFTFTHGTLSVAGSNLEVRSASISVDNGLAIDRHRLRTSNPARPAEPLENGLREIGGTVDADFENLTAYNRFVNGTEASLVLAFNAGASAQLTATLNVRFDGETPNVGGPELLPLALPFKAVSSTSDAAAVTFTLVNADAAP